MMEGDAMGWRSAVYMAADGRRVRPMMYAWSDSMGDARRNLQQDGYVVVRDAAMARLLGEEFDVRVEPHRSGGLYVTLKNPSAENEYAAHQYADMSPEQVERAKRLAEKLKGQEGVENPHALARWIVQRQ